MGFLRSMATQAIGVASMGAAATLMSKLLGIDKATVVVGMVGAVIGWVCCWLYTGWISTAETRSGHANDVRLTRSAIQRTEIDRGIRMAMPPSIRDNNQHEERQ